jgi:hypothetical protein
VGIVPLPEAVFHIPIAGSPSDFRKVNGSLYGLDLAIEESPGRITFGMGPMLKEPGSCFRDVSCISAFPPLLYLLPNLVDELVLFDPVLGPLCFEGKLTGFFLPRTGNGDEVGTGATAGNDFVGYAVF